MSDVNQTTDQHVCCCGSARCEEGSPPDCAEWLDASGKRGVGGWNAAIEAVHRVIAEAADGRGALWTGADEAGDVLDKLPNAIWEMRRG